jgi:hypothetical protein
LAGGSECEANNSLQKLEQHYTGGKRNIRLLARHDSMLRSKSFNTRPNTGAAARRRRATRLPHHIRGSGTPQRRQRSARRTARAVGADQSAYTRPTSQRGSPTAAPPRRHTHTQRSGKPLLSLIGAIRDPDGGEQSGEADQPLSRRRQELSWDRALHVHRDRTGDQPAESERHQKKASEQVRSSHVCTILLLQAADHRL